MPPFGRMHKFPRPSGWKWWDERLLKEIEMKNYIRFCEADEFGAKCFDKYWDDNEVHLDYINVTCVKRALEEPCCPVHGTPEGRQTYLEGDQPDGSKHAQRICTCQDEASTSLIPIRSLRDPKNLDDESVTDPFNCNFAPVKTFMLTVLHAAGDEGIAGMGLIPRPDSKELLRQLAEDPTTPILQPVLEAGDLKEFFKTRDDDEKLKSWRLLVDDGLKRIDFARDFYADEIRRSLKDFKAAEHDIELLQEREDDDPQVFANLKNSEIGRLFVTRDAAIYNLRAKKNFSTLEHSRHGVCRSLTNLMFEILCEAHAFEVSLEHMIKLEKISEPLKTPSPVLFNEWTEQRKKLFKAAVNFLDITHFNLILRVENLQADLAHVAKKRQETADRIKGLKMRCLEGRRTGGLKKDVQEIWEKGSCCEFIRFAGGVFPKFDPEEDDEDDEFISDFRAVTSAQTLKNLRIIEDYLENHITPIFTRCIARTATLLEFVTWEILDVGAAFEKCEGAGKFVKFFETSSVQRSWDTFLYTGVRRRMDEFEKMIADERV